MAYDLIFCRDPVTGWGGISFLSLASILETEVSYDIEESIWLSIDYELIKYVLIATCLSLIVVAILAIIYKYLKSKISHRGYTRSRVIINNSSQHLNNEWILNESIHAPFTNSIHIQQLELPNTHTKDTSE